MNFGSSVLHIVVEPAQDCRRYVGVEDTIEQLLLVHIAECSCQNERDKHCSVSRLSSVSDESHVEQGGKGCVSILGSRSYSSVLAAGHSGLIWRQFLPMLLSLPGLSLVVLARIGSCSTRPPQGGGLLMLIKDTIPFVDNTAAVPQSADTHL